MYINNKSDKVNYFQFFKTLNKLKDGINHLKQYQVNDQPQDIIMMGQKDEAMGDTG